MTRDELMEMLEVQSETAPDAEAETQTVTPETQESEESESATADREPDPEPLQLSREEVRTILQELFAQKTLTGTPPTMSDTDAYLANPDSMTSRLLKSYGIKETE